MKEFIEGSRAVAEAVRLCKPGVISAYPITPQTHIVEELAQMVAEGSLNSQFVNVESEHSAASVVLGASATGVRAYTASSSQGILLMCEVLFNIAGMRLPLVLTCANRAISAPINIWNDQQDSISMRDAGWVQIYAENNQEAADMHFIAYRLAEDKNIMLPVMVCMDGFILTHGIETVDIPKQEEVDKFLPVYSPLYKLDTATPMTLGPLVGPDYYLETRYAIQETHKDVLTLLPKLAADFKAVFGRDYKNLLIEEYRTEGAEKVIVAMGSVCGTVKTVVDQMRAKGKKVGLLRVVSYRPFPYQEVYQALKDIPKVAVLDKSVSLGGYAPLAVEVKAACYGKKKTPKVISSFVAGLGGRDITVESIEEIYRRLTTKEVNLDFIDLKPELLKEKYGQ
ncbi:MAG: pyruvate ferredoxin oxidoreductase [Candidatus Omnitrophica bacterium]|nr:pyruvate ferredoxin oxidoreductase [Candidatus Omnitrophota bacterium]MDD5237016.1 pyruvate ferredoxin oxidoreductase [Candidatus Omnitrophota bacterium]MDD5610286.1 pyruvate ferredoxin oxidoreductase [Candidatus Omnitrophota bacterium]